VCTSSTSGHEALSGCATVLGDTITSMELLIKSTKLQPVIKASFRSDKQWKLQQVQDAYNHMGEVKQLLIELKEKKPSPQYLPFVLNKTITHLRQCQQRLVSPSFLTLNELVNSALSVRNFCFLITIYKATEESS